MSIEIGVGRCSNRRVSCAELFTLEAGVDRNSLIQKLPSTRSTRRGKKGEICVNGGSEHSLRLLLPKKRPDLVLDGGGGGFSNCEAVGAREVRIEYVRCMVEVCCDEYYAVKSDERGKSSGIVRSTQWQWRWKETKFGSRIQAPS